MGLVLTAACAIPDPAPTGEDVHIADSLSVLLVNHHVPGLALARVRAADVAWTGGFGMRDARSGEPVTPATVFEAASLSKPVFAYMVLKIADAGGIDLDAPVADQIREVEAGDPRVRTVTARQILSHTAGFPAWHRGRQVRLETDPGEQWRYSGAGYVFLQKAMETLTGQSLETLSEQLVFAPLGMRRSSFGWRSGLGPDVALPHDSLGRPLEPHRFDETLVDHVGAAATLYTTAADFARFLAAIAASESPPSLTVMFEPVAEVDEDLGLSWGLGWAIQQDPSGNLAFHWGANPHFRAFAMIRPETGDGWVALTNAPLGLELMDELADLLTGTIPPLFKFYMLHPTD